MAGAEAEQAGADGTTWCPRSVAGDGRAEAEEPLEQALEVRMEGCGGLGIVVQGNGTGGMLGYQGKLWEEILHPQASEVGDRRRCPLQWHRWEIFPRYSIKVGLL